MISGPAYIMLDRGIYFLDICFRGGGIQLTVVTGVFSMIPVCSRM